MASYTLITGDVVEFAMGEVNSFNSTGTLKKERHDHVFFIPSSAVPAIHSGKLHTNLFNLTQLEQAQYDDVSKAVLPVLIKCQGELSQHPGLTIKRQFKIINYLSATLDKSALNTLLPALLSDEQLIQIQLDEVKSLTPPSSTF